MTQPQRNTTLAAAIVAGLLSIPMTWMTIQITQMPGSVGSFSFASGGMTFDVTGLNGHVTFLVKTPFWFLACLAIAASVLQLMSGTKSFAIPKAAEWTTAIAALVWILIAIVMTVFSGQSSLGLGSLLALCSAALPVICLKLETADQPIKDEVHNSTVS